MMREGFKTIFDSVFHNAKPDEIGCFLRNEMVSFEYCEMALKMKGIGWKNKLIIAKRSDCPIDVMSRICKNGGDRLLDDLFATMRVIPEKVIREIYKKDGTSRHLISYWRLPDDIKSKMFQSFLVRDEQDRIVRYKHYMNDFLQYQIYLPDDCWNVMDDVLKIWEENPTDCRWDRNFVEMTRPMMTPLDDNVALAGIEYAVSCIRINGSERSLLMKLAANPGISDYALMELQVKCPNCAIDDVNEIIAKRKSARDEYRRMHA